METIKTIKALAVMALICVAAPSFAQQTRLIGDIKGLGDVEFNMGYYDGVELKRAKILATNGKFSWTGNMKEPQKVTLMFSNQAAGIYLEPGTIRLTGTADSLFALTVKGSKSQAEAEAFEAIIMPINDRIDSLYQKFGELNNERKLARKQQIAELTEQIRFVQEQYIASHPESIVSLTMATERASMGEYQEILAIYGLLGPMAKSSAEGIRLADRLAVLKRSAIGSPMLNFTQNDVDGKPVSFSSFKGKYVLVDFWASWCGPCRAENPNVLKVYNRYKDKGFTVLGISLDHKVENWKKAIKDDGMPWTQLSDLKGWKNEVSTYYGIMGIPSTLLINPEGNIIAKDLIGATLDQKLEEIFNQKTN